MALSIGSLVATLDADPTQFVAGLSAADLALHGLSRDADGRLRDMQGRFVSTAEAARSMGHGVQTAAHDAGDGLHHMTAGADDSHRSMTRLLGTARSLAGGIGRVAAGMAPLLAQLGSAVPLVAGLVGTLESIVPAGAVAVTGILAVVTVTGTLKLAMHGVGDAVKAAFDPGTKPAELREALKGLAPPARRFVLALRSLHPQLHALQQDVQGAVFAGLGDRIKTLAGALLPVLQTQLYNTGFVLNGMAKGAIDAGTKLGKSGILGTALDGVNNALYDMQGIPGQVVTALGQLGAAGAPYFEKLGTAAGNAATRISDKLSAAFKSGALSSAIDTAVGVIKQIGTVIGNVGKIIGQVFKAAGNAGGSWLGVLEQITGAAAKAFASPGVQSALSALFGVMKTLGDTVGPLVSQALQAIAPVLTALGPPANALVKALGAALQPIIKALGPILVSAAQAVGKLVDALSPLLPIIGDLIADLLPVLTPVLDLLTGIFTDLAGPIKQVAQALSKTLKPIIKGLTTVVQDLVDQYLTIFLDLLGQFLPLLPQLTPVLIQLGESIGQILAAVAPLLPQLASMAIMFAIQLLPAILPLVPPLLQLTSLLLTLATDVIVKIVVPALQHLIDFMHGLQAKLQPAIDAIKWLTTGIASLFEWLADHLVGHSVIPDMVRDIVSWLAGLPGKALGALAGIGRRLAGVMEDATNAMIRATTAGLRAIVSWISDLPDRAVRALGDLSGKLWSAGRSLLNGFIGGIRSKIGAVKSTLGGITSSLTSWKGPPARDAVLLRPAGQLVLGGFIRGIADQVPALRAQLGGITTGLSGMALGSGLGSLAGAGTPAGAGARTGAGGQPAAVVRFDVTGADEDMLRLIRRMVTVQGGGGSGSVQRAFG